ncbi:dermonecrotic toxin domain-containing protein [Pseudomonas sp. 22082]|uniref:dermonecrotic toxin domain-containing protein n=1 Tax=Pseudomonas sp. 22082 TaxID=3453868 RepID=UPI003F8702B2
MPTLPAPAAPGTPGTTDIIARAVNARFPDRPTLRSQTARLLNEGLLEKYPDLDFDPYRTRIAQPTPNVSWRLSLLLDEVLEYLASGVKLDLGEQHGFGCFLTNQVPKWLRVSETSLRFPDMQVVADVILELPQILYISLQQSLTAYWNDDNHTGSSRWQWLGDLLAGELQTAAIRHTDLDASQAAVLTELANRPDRQVRLQKPWSGGVIQACTVQTKLSKGSVSAIVQTPDLLVSCAQTHLLCSVTGSVKAYTSLDAFGLDWAKRFQQDFAVDTVTWQRFEPDGNLFDTQAALMLNQQLENLAALKLPAHQSLEELQKRVDAITDIARNFSDPQPGSPHLEPIQASLPQWLQTASATDRMAYRQHVLALASLRHKNQGRSFSDGIDNIYTYAQKALHKQMLEDQPLAPGYNSDELELTFHVPVGDLGSGYIEKVKMSLTELAIKNLSGKPKGRMTIRHTGNQLIQDWTTEAYLLSLVKRVDIGKHYPEQLNGLLLGDSPEARERERLFALELAVQLPLQALEHSIRGEHGFNRQGYRYVNALTKSTAAERIVDEQAIVLRPLAFQRKADAACDVVANMFVIEPKDLNAEGPRILYRPLYAPALQQFASRADLLKAICLAGPLQDSVLAWLTDRARPIYANNGFNEPHISHFHIGDDFTPFEKPAPAILVSDAAAADWLKAVEGNRVLSSLFVSNAQALIQLADQQSVSDSESRWAIILEGAWLIFNVLLLPLDGPAMMVGWMLQLTHSLINDLPALDSDDAVARNLAWTDLLLNIGLVLLHVAKDAGTASVSHRAEKLAPIQLEPLRHPSTSFPMPLDTVIHQDAAALPSAAPINTPLDFHLSTARGSIPASWWKQLQEVHVPWPAPLPEPMATGAFKGLYRIDNQWHASVAGLLVPVRIVEGFGEVYLDLKDKPGIQLKSNENGQWKLDRGLRLAGGGPKSRIQAQRKAVQDRIKVLDDNYAAFINQQEQVQKAVDIAEQVMRRQQDLPAAAEETRAKSRKAYDRELEKQTATYISQIAEKKEIAALKKIDPEYSGITTLLQNSINNVRKRNVLADLERQAMLRRYTEFNRNARQVAETLLTGNAATRVRYLDFLRETSDINETMIKQYEEVDRLLLELKEIPRLGLTAWEQLTANRAGKELSPVQLKAFQLQILRPLSVKTWGLQSVLGLDDAVDPLVLLSRSHADLQGAEIRDSADRIAVFDNLVVRYGLAQDALEGIGIFHGDELQPTYFNRLREIAGELRIDAERRLADELQSSPEPEDTPGTSANINRPPIRPPAPRASRKRVIKTNTKGALIGDLRARVGDQGADIVDVKGPMEDSALLSFRENQPNVWEEIVAPEQPQPAAPVTPYPQLKGDARKALANVDKQVHKIEGYALRATYPKEIEEQIQREARKLTDFADKLEHHERAPLNQEQDVDLISRLRAKANVLETMATEIRTQMTLARPPTSEGVAYLLQNNSVYVRMTGNRVQLKTGRKDFMQEYVLLDQQEKPVWYGHFHYANATDEKSNYTRAHLKTREDRYETYESAMLKAKSAQQKIDIHKGRISDELAENVFLPVEPR